MNLPDYWMPRPAASLTEEARSSFDALLARIQSGAENAHISYTLPFPKWQFLCYAAEQHSIAVHGTGDPNIRVFEPRQSNDLNEFGNRKAVYAAGDGIWAMFFAVIDRARYPMTISNACIRLSDSTGFVSEPLYVFSISQTQLPHRPWRRGYVYLLPAETFSSQPAMSFGPYEVHIPQLASLMEVKPLATLEVAPEDFPFLAQIRSHDDDRLEELSQALQTGGPWPEPKSRADE